MAMRGPVLGLGIHFGGGSFGPIMPPPPPPPLMRILPPIPLPPPPPHTGLDPRAAFKRVFPPATFKRPAAFPIFPLATKKLRFEKKVVKPPKPAEKPPEPAVATESSAPSVSTAGGTTTLAVASQSPQANQELKVPPEMTQPLFCKLCEAKLNSPLQASAHYEGKNHAKKERMYLEKMREEKGIRGPLVRNNTKQEKKGLEEEYCKLCSVAFTSEIQAKQHYNGRNHQRRLRGEPPLPKGFYNPLTGKWQRQPPSGVPVRLTHQGSPAMKGTKFDSGMAKACFMNAFVTGGQVKMAV